MLTLSVISGWIGTRAFQHGHLNPAWFIPAVGNVIVPITGAQLPRILRLPFAMSFWALSFPVAGLTIASFLYAEKTGPAAHLLIGTGLLTRIIAGLVGRTALAMARGQICVPE